MYTENQKNYVQKKCNLLKDAENNGESVEVTLIPHLAKNIFYYVLKKEYDTEGWEPTSDEDDELPDTCTKEQLLDGLLEIGCDKRIVDCIAEHWVAYNKAVDDIKNGFDNAKFGTELEYGGRGEFVNVNNYKIIEDYKHDGSVSGSGREYNLIPMEISHIYSKDWIKTELEKFMKENANQRSCTEHSSAGEHIHYSYDAVCQEHGSVICNTINDICSITRINGAYNTFIKLNTDVMELEKTKQLIKLAEEENNITYKYLRKNEANKFIKIYEAYQYLYSISNRTGNEHYGLGRDVTRGYTCHHTIEIRCWRTTLDFRSVIARAHVGWEWLKWMIEKVILSKYNFIDWEEESIWEKVQKEGLLGTNRRHYLYLAFHYANKHNVGLTEKQIIEKLGISQRLATAIKNRSRMFAKQLVKGTPEDEAKQIFNIIY